MQSFENFIKNSEIVVKLSYQDLDLLTHPEADVCVAIKTMDHRYQFANKNFAQLYGMSKSQEVVTRNDEDLTANENLIKTYQEHDDVVFKEDQAKSFRELVEPKLRKNFSGFMQCKILPLQINSRKTNALLRIYKPEGEELFLNLDKLLPLSSKELDKRFTKKSYHFLVDKTSFSFSKREMLCLIELLKGKHAGEIAAGFGLKQTTIESYILSLKNKCGVMRKSELVSFFIQNQIFKRIIG